MRTTHHQPRTAETTDEPSAPEVATAAVRRLSAARDVASIEQLADDLAAAGVEHWNGRARRALIEALILCLTGESVREDPDTEDAVCSLLAQLGVTRRVGNLVFEFVPASEIEPTDLVAVRRYQCWLSPRYRTGETERRG